MGQKQSKVYLGDGVYVERDGHDLILTTSDGVDETNRIVLEFDVYSRLQKFVEQSDRL